MSFRSRSVLGAIMITLVTARGAPATQMFCCQTTNGVPQRCTGTTTGSSPDCQTGNMWYPNAMWTASVWGPSTNFCACQLAPDIHGICEGHCSGQPTPVIDPTVTPTPTPPTPTPEPTSTPIFAKTLDHLECYKISDSQKVRGLAHFAGPQFGLEPGCKIGVARKFCVPVAKAVDPALTTVDGVPWVQTYPFGSTVSCTGGANDGAPCTDDSECPGGTCTTTPIPGQNLVEDYICYKSKCLTKGRTPLVEDQFGQRRLNIKTAYELCVPARKVCHCDNGHQLFTTTCSPTKPDSCRQHPGSWCTCL